MIKIYYEAKHNEGMIDLYSVVATNFGGDAKNFVRSFPFMTDAVSFAENNGWEKKHLYDGDFSPDKRMDELIEKLEKYHLDTPNSMGNKEAYQYWVEFREWARVMGYTGEEINKAKRRINPSVFGDDRRL